MKITKFESDYLTISLDLENQFIYTECRGFTNMNDIKEGMSALLELIRETGVSKVLANHYQWEVISEQATNWIINQWFALAIDAGFSKLAELVSHDVFNSISVSEGLDEVAEKNPGFCYQHFEDLQTAKDWLLQN